jgi:phage baseplate assembly protein W
VSLLAYWSFDSGAAVDLTGNGHNGVDTNMSYGAPAKLGAAAAQFAGAGGNRSVFPAIAGGGTWSTAGWARAHAIAGGGGGAVAMVFGDGATQRGMRWKSDRFNFLFTAGFDLPAAAGLVLDTWYHLGIACHANGGDVDLYFNGALDRTIFGWGINFSPERFGADLVGPDYNGAVDEWGFWNRLLTAPEFATLYNGGAGMNLYAPGFPDGIAPPPPPPLPPITLQQPLVAQLPSSVDFGQDIDASAGLNPYMRLIGGLPNVGQALLHRLSTPRGSLPYDANYGYDVRELLNETMTPTRQAQAQVAIAGECRKDERVQACNVALNLTGTTLTLYINITTAAGPFRLVLAVTAVSVQLLAVTPS